MLSSKKSSCLLLYRLFVVSIVLLNPLTVTALNDPAQNFNLTIWKLQLPVDSNNKFVGSSAQVYPITSSYTNNPYFYTNVDNNGIVFYAPYNGVTTSNSIHPRSELRQMKGPYMTLSGGYWDMYKVFTSFTATLAVNQLALLNTGNWATVVIGQIHAPSGEQVRLYYQSSGAIYWGSSPPSGTSCASINNIYLFSSTKTKSAIPLNSIFSYNIQTNTTHLLVYAKYNGVEYSSTRMFDICWTSSNVGAYYKAGCYCQVNNLTGKYDGTGACKVSFYEVSQPILRLSSFATGPLFTSSKPITSPTGMPHSTVPSSKPTFKTTLYTFAPTKKPTVLPTRPSKKPSRRPQTKKPSFKPTLKPTKSPL